eukprot:RCo016941
MGRSSAPHCGAYTRARPAPLVLWSPELASTHQHPAVMHNGLPHSHCETGAEQAVDFPDTTALPLRRIYVREVPRPASSSSPPLRWRQLRSPCKGGTAEPSRLWGALSKLLAGLPERLDSPARKLLGVLDSLFPGRLGA